MVKYILVGLVVLMAGFSAVAEELVSGISRCDPGTQLEYGVPAEEVIDPSPSPKGSAKIETFGTYNGDKAQTDMVEYQEQSSSK